MWGLHDTTEIEKQGRPTVTVSTTAFSVAGRARAQILGMGELPIVAIVHPLASKTESEARVAAEAIVKRIVQGLAGTTR